jgi:hypothetical protein
MKDKTLSETAKTDPEYSSLESLDNTGRYLQVTHYMNPNITTQ